MTGQVPAGIAAISLLVIRVHQISDLRYLR